MPQIRMLQSVAGVDGSWNRGELVEVSQSAADVWADGVRAELVEQAAPETTASRSRRGGRSAKTETG